MTDPMIEQLNNAMSLCNLLKLKVCLRVSKNNIISV